MRIRSARIASSLTSAMLTRRKMFSSSFAISATSGVETGTSSSQIAPVHVERAGRCRPRSGHRRSSACSRACSRCGPGRRAPGENASAKSLPASSPDSSSSGTRWSRVVPGKVVDSSTTSWPFAITPASVRAAPSSGPRSGSRFRFSGVGTQTRIASAPCRSTARVVKLVRSGTACSRSDGMSSMYECRVVQVVRSSPGRRRRRSRPRRPPRTRRERQPDVAQADDADAHARDGSGRAAPGPGTQPPR